MKHATHVSVTLCMMMLVGCGGGGGGSAPSPPQSSPPAASAGTGVPQLTRTVVMTASNPWDLAFAPDGTMFFTERCNGMSVRKVNGTVQRVFGTTGSPVIADDLFCEGQSG